MRIGQGLIAAVALSLGMVTIPAYGAQQQVIKNVELQQSYDEASGRFIQMLDGQAGFSSTIPQDMITSGGVRFDHFTDDVIYILEKNGRSVDYESGQVITESGQYHLQLLVMPQINLEGMEEPSMEQLQNEEFVLENLQILDRDYTIAADFYFTIMGTALSNLEYVKAPEGYRISQLRLDGNPQKVEDSRWCRTVPDGTYEIQFQSIAEVGPDLETVFVKDTQPPLLRLEGVDRMGKAKKSVRYTCNEENCTVEVYREGYQVKEVTGEIHTPGLYRLVVRDQAGNGTSYLIQVKDSYPFVLLFLLLGGIAALAGAAYLVFRNQSIIVR